MMTPEQIKTGIGIEDLNIREGDTGEFYWVSLARMINGRAHSRSMRLMKDATPEQMAAAKAAFEVWWTEEQE